MPKHAIIGLGEVGTSLRVVMEEEIDKVSGFDEGDDIDGESADFLHICFPYSDDFIEEVEKYQEAFEPEVTIIHSTVKIGTTDQIHNAVHSPIRGTHPNLELGIRTFVKYIGGPKRLTKKVAEELQKVCPVVQIPDKADSEFGTGAEHTEAAKLWSTTYYGVLILFQKLVQRWCEEEELNPELVYRHWNMTYNEGYANLGRPMVVRAVLEYIEGEIGGHCITANKEILDHDTINELFDRENY